MGWGALFGRWHPSYLRVAWPSCFVLRPVYFYVRASKQHISYFNVRAMTAEVDSCTDDFWLASNQYCGKGRWWLLPWPFIFLVALSNFCICRSYLRHRSILLNYFSRKEVFLSAECITHALIVIVISQSFCGFFAVVPAARGLHVFRSMGSADEHIDGSEINKTVLNWGMRGWIFVRGERKH